MAEDPNLLVGTRTSDDAGVYLFGENTALVQTMDVITPVEGWPDGAGTVVVMLDGQCAFMTIPRDEMRADGITIWWGAYLGLPQEITIHGPLTDHAWHRASANASATSGGSGNCSNPNSRCTANCICDLGARPLPVRVFLMRVAA